MYLAVCSVALYCSTLVTSHSTSGCWEPSCVSAAWLLKLPNVQVCSNAQYRVLDAETVSSLVGMDVNRWHVKTGIEVIWVLQVPTAAQQR